MWGHFKDGILKACDEVCGKKRGRRSKGDTWWWNEAKEAVSIKKAISKAMREKAVEALPEYKNGCLGQ